MSAIASTQVPRIANGYRLQFEDAQDIWVLLYPEGMVKLNPSAAQILQRCDGKANVQDIVDQLERAFETSGLSDDVQGFLAIAHEQHWITLG
ncbi:pyrroloquinoline quinone biosynthesis peptide chaperone PqqD [Granulosicoccus sp. 3-233]|uniref:pyrroloquinoline quinone biosynthesis peptide chaperone PqqD n=1 Tax=Granulosicoccus sp. 3-233 TaxID=3417969 RepID=UPI003D34BD2E